ncbi:hypothetical protein BDV3_003452 [Batrachochytrium dendrobatidis]
MNNADYLMAEMMGLPSGFGKSSRRLPQSSKVSSASQAQSDKLQNHNPDQFKSDGATSTLVSDHQQPKQPVSLDDIIGPLPATHSEFDTKNNELQSDSDLASDSSCGDEQDNEVDAIPTTMAALKDHTKAVAALSLDPAASRMITAGRDCTVKLWDFYGMTTSMKPFRTLEPSLGNPIRDVQFSTTGDQFLVAAATSQLKVYDRDGGFITEFPKGDPYIRDLRHTKGHVSALTNARWNPTMKNCCISASTDSTIRIWDLEQATARRQKDVIYVKSRQPGGRTSITAVCFSNDGRLIAGAGADGSLRIWNSNGPFLTPIKNVDNAHLPGGAASSISFAMDGHSLITRAMDNTLKLWDIRKFKEPVAVATDLEGYFEETNAVFSPNDRYIITGTSAKKGCSDGSIVVFDRHTLKMVESINIPGSVVKIQWSGKLGQIFAGTSEGAVQVLYDPVLSRSGIKVPLSKKPKKLTVEDYDILISRDTMLGPIINPGVNTGGSKFQSKRKMLEQEAISRRPEIPSAVLTKGKGGKIGTNMTQGIMKDMMKDTRRQEDPREAILKFADTAAADPYWIAPAYKVNQPNAVLTEKVYENDFEEDLEKRKKRRQ